MFFNIGNVDRLIRVILGLILISLALTGIIGFWGFIGVMPLVTAAFGFCPAYGVLGVNTCKTKQI